MTQQKQTFNMRKTPDSSVRRALRDTDAVDGMRRRVLPLHESVLANLVRARKMESVIFICKPYQGIDKAKHFCTHLIFLKTYHVSVNHTFRKI